MLFLHLKSGHIYEYLGLTVIEAGMVVAVRYHPMGLPEHEFTRPASEFFDGRFKPFVPNEAFADGFFDEHGRAHFGPVTKTMMGEEADDDHEHFVEGPKKVTHGAN